MTINNNLPVTIKERALYLYDLGYNIFPTTTKAPFDTQKEWKEYQKEKPSREEVAEWFNDTAVTRIWVHCGLSHIVCLDFDTHADVNYCESLEAELPFLKKYPKERTLNGGYHILFKKDLMPFPQQFAKFYNGELDGNGKPKEQPFIETRSRHTGFVCGLSEGYELIRGSYGNIPVMPLAEYMRLEETAKKYDNRQKQLEDVKLKAHTANLELTSFEQVLLRIANERTSSSYSSYKKNVGKPNKKLELIDCPIKREKYSLMTNDEKDDFLRHLLPTYLKAQGFEPYQNMSCPDESHADHNPSCHINKEGTSLTCWSHVTLDGKPQRFSIFDLVGIAWNLEFPESKMKTEEIFGLTNQQSLQQMNDPFEYLNHPELLNVTDNTSEPVTSVVNLNDEPDYCPDDEEEIEPVLNSIPDTVATSSQTTKNIVDKFLDWHNNSYTIEMWANRGINKETVEKFVLGYNPSENALTIPYLESTGCYTRRFLAPDAKPKYKKSEGCNDLFNTSTIYENDIIYVTESEIDAMVIEQAGEACIGLGGKNADDKFVTWLGAFQKEFLEKKTIVLCLDNDEPGQKQQKAFLTKLTDIGVNVIEYCPFSGYKDPNEALLADSETFAKAVAVVNNPEQLKLKLAEDYIRAESMLSSADSLWDSLTNPLAQRKYSTGIDAIDKALDGGLKAELYVFGAMSSLGKTTLLHQIADYRVQQGDNVLFYSLEMSKKDLAYKSLARLAKSQAENTENRKHILLTGEPATLATLYNWSHTFHAKKEQQALHELLREYNQKIANGMFVKEADGALLVTDIRTDVEKHIEMTGKKPLIVLDYLQLLASPNDRWDEKRTVDFNISELKRLSRDFEIPVLTISSFNRASYSEKISMSSFKESGSIEYGCDVLMGMQLAGLAHVPSTVQGRAIQRALENAVDSQKANGNELMLDLRILKNRSGITGCTNIAFDSKSAYFHSQPSKETWLKAIWQHMPSSTYTRNPVISNFICDILGNMPSSKLCEELDAISDKNVNDDEDMCGEYFIKSAKHQLTEIDE